MPVVHCQWVWHSGQVQQSWNHKQQSVDKLCADRTSHRSFTGFAHFCPRCIFWLFFEVWKEPESDTKRCKVDEDKWTGIVQMMQAHCITLSCGTHGSGQLRNTNCHCNICFVVNPIFVNPIVLGVIVEIVPNCWNGVSIVFVSAMQMWVVSQVLLPLLRKSCQDSNWSVLAAHNLVPNWAANSLDKCMEVWSPSCSKECSRRSGTGPPSGPPCPENDSYDQELLEGAGKIVPTNHRQWHNVMLNNSCTAVYFVHMGRYLFPQPCKATRTWFLQNLWT